MPITVTATAGILDEAAEKHILPRLSEALLARNGMAGNTFMTPIVVGSLHILPEGRIFAGGRAEQAIFVELKVPSVTFGSQEQRQGFVDDANSILNELTHGTYPKDKTFVNITYAVDGSWGVAGKAWTNAELGKAAALAAEIPA
jgi:phenylpyruvate tautomerase PptA (4-oxalocrotonate tautomerase family)